MRRIEALEGLRGLLALWVVIGHSLRICGFNEGNLGPFGLIAQPGLAVDVFIILSGFVISNLLEREHSYRRFIIRRFFRLAPLYYAVLTVAALTLQAQADLAGSLPWSGGGRDKIFADTLAAFPQQLLAHLTMLHGLAPFPSSDYAFVGQAWSISVEWQFYLVAPLVLGCLFARRWAAVSLIILALFGLRLAGHGNEGSALTQAGYFMIGIGSYFAWKHLSIDDEARLAVALIASAGLYFLLHRWLSQALWGIVLASILPTRAVGVNVLRPLPRFLANPAILWLGKISYSVYLVHMLVIYLLLSLFLQAGWDRLSVARALPFAAVAITLAISWATHELIEVPGIAIGRWLTQRRQGDTAAKPEGIQPP